MILSSFYYEVLQECCHVKKSQEHVAVLAFFDQQKGSVTSNKNTVTEQPILLTKRNINRRGYKFSKYFR